MIEVAPWVPWLLLAVGFVLGMLAGAVLTVDTLREHGWRPTGTWVAPEVDMPDEVAEIADAIYRPRGPHVTRRGGTLHWETPTVVPWPHLGDRR